LLSIISYGKSDVGRLRTNNEDAFVAIPESHLFAVADGMGGAAAGEVASQVFAETTLRFFFRTNLQSLQDTVELVLEAFKSANASILQHARKHPGHQGMGCTGELLTFHDERFVLGHVGDSRTYQFRAGRLRQLTHDHSLIQELIDAGVYTEAEARGHPLRSVLLRAVGTNDPLDVDLIQGEIQAGDIFLICSDGLTDMVSDDSIRQVLATPQTLSWQAGTLIDLANASGGRDNITVVLAQVVAAD
jgi:protein phosphatase